LSTDPMSDNHDASSAARDLIYPQPKESDARSKDSEPAAPQPPPSAKPPGGESGAVAAEVLPLVETVLRRWRLLLGCGVLLGLLGLGAGWKLWKKEYSAVAQLVYADSPIAVDVFGQRQISPQTFVAMFRSPELLREVAAEAKPPVSAEQLAGGLQVVPEHNSDIFAVAISGRTPDATVNLINLYAQKAARTTQKMQADSALEVSRYLAQQIARLDQDILAAQPIPLALPEPPPVGAAVPVTLTKKILPDPRVGQLTTRLDTARDDLFDMTTRFTDAHPVVVAQRARIAVIAEQLHVVIAAAPVEGTPEPLAPGASALLPATVRPAAPPAIDPEVLRSKLQSLENSRVQLVGRQRAAQAFAENAPGYFRVLAPAALKDLVVHSQVVKIMVLTLFCGFLGVAGAAGLVVSCEVMDDHLKTAADVKRVTQLPMLASLINMEKMSPVERRNWAFRTWTALQNRMSHSPNHGLVCGVTSSSAGEGRSTWVNLLAKEASQLGFRVLTIATIPSSADAANENTRSANTSQANDHGLNPQTVHSTLIASNALSAPAEVTQQLTGPNQELVVHVPLPGWVWNLERRKQWQGAINHWQSIDNIVILVELPPSNTPEAVLLAQNLPNIVWLSDSGKATAAETRTQLETLRHARCHLVGAVLNHAPKLALQNRFPRWFNHAT
jgi:capsular polysaccharide biosynthesis protein